MFQEQGAFLENAPIPCVVLDRGGKVLMANRAAGAILRRDPAGMTGADLSAVFRPSGELLSLLRSRSARRRSEGMRGRLVRGSEELPVSIRLQRFRTAGRKSCDVMWIRDDRDLQELHRRLEHSEKLSAMAIVAGKVAHEIRTPLNAIFLNNDLLQERVQKVRGLQGERLQRYMGILQEEVERLNEVVRSYLSLARLAGGDRQPTAVEGALSDFIEEVRDEYAGHRISFATSFRSRNEPIPLNRRQFRRVLLNLFSNSRDAMRAGGVITVSTVDTAGAVRITFSDTGEGIPPDALSQLTRPFTSHKDNGSGLGLYLVREIVEHHGGTLDIQSLHGEGTSVIVTLPRASGGAGSRT